MERNNNIFVSQCRGENGVIPIAMKVVRGDLESGELCVARGFHQQVGARADYGISYAGTFLKKRHNAAATSTIGLYGLAINSKDRATSIGADRKPLFEEVSMLKVRRAEQRGQTLWKWLDSRHTFSFGEYYDPQHSGFRSLRVINNDRVKPAEGFGTHSHRDMEIISYVLEGSLEHKDSMGTGSVIVPGEIQMMRAGTGISHSEYNHSRSEPVHFLQIWIEPDSRGLAPAYFQQAVDRKAAQSHFALLASKSGREHSVQIHQDVELWLGLVDSDQPRKLSLSAGRSAWVHIARGRAAVNGVNLTEGDGLAASDERELRFSGRDAEILVFDLA